MSVGASSNSLYPGPGPLGPRTGGMQGPRGGHRLQEGGHRPARRHSTVTAIQVGAAGGHREIE